MLFLRSVLVGIIDLLLGVLRRNVSLTFSKFNNLIMDEPIVVIIREHRQVITVLDHPNIRPLTKQYASWFTKYFGSYLAKSFPKMNSSRDHKIPSSVSVEAA